MICFQAGTASEGKATGGRGVSVLICVANICLESKVQTAPSQTVTRIRKVCQESRSTPASIPDQQPFPVGGNRDKVGMTDWQRAVTRQHQSKRDEWGRVQ